MGVLATGHYGIFEKRVWRAARGSLSGGVGGGCGTGGLATRRATHVSSSMLLGGAAGGVERVWSRQPLSIIRSASV